MRLGTNGNNTAVTIDSEQRLGLGITSPSDYVDEKNNFVLGATTGHTGMTIVSGNTAIGTIQFRGDTSVNNNEGWIDYSQNTQKMRFGTNGLNTALTLENDQKATFAGDVETTGGRTVAVKSLTNSDSTYAVVASDYVLSCDTSSGVLVITLPAATAIGRMLHICDTAGAADSNAITINVESSGSETIQGDTSLVISGEYASATLVNSATNKWSVL